MHTLFTNVNTEANMWAIETMNHMTLEWTRLAPRVDGTPRTFATKADAVAYAYEYGYAGKRNSFVRYVRV